MEKQLAFTPAERKLAAGLFLKRYESACKATVKYDVVQQLLKCGFDLQHSKQLVNEVANVLLP